MTKEVMKHYEAALLEAFPRGATGDVFYHWNKARQAIEQAEKQEQGKPVAWLIDDKSINHLQIKTIQRLIERANHAHMTDIKLRINGQDEWYEGDWIKHMVEAPKPKQEQGEPVTTDWERIARVQNAKLMAMSDTVGGFEKLREVLDKYEAITPQQRKPLTIEQIGDFWLDRFDKEGSPIENFARAIESAHGIKE